MKIKIISFTKSEENHIREGIEVYLKRLLHYTRIEEIIIKPPKEAEITQQVKKEAELLKQKITDEDLIVLLDDKGKSFTSQEFANWLTTNMNSGRKSVCFIIGGAYGFSEEIYKRSNEKLSLSRMTLPHQLAKLVFTEQLYRAFTIIKGEKYHH